MKVQIICEQGIELDPQDAAFREERSVLLYDREKCGISAGSGITTASPKSAPHFVPPM